MSTFKKKGDWHDLGYGHKFLLVESSYSEKVCGGILVHNVLGTNQRCEPGLVAWEQPGGPVRPLFRVTSRPRDTLSLEPFIVCEVCGDKGWIQNGKWVPKHDVSEDTPAQDPIASVPVEGEDELFTLQVRRDLGDIVLEEEVNADRKLYDLAGGPDTVLDPIITEEKFEELTGDNLVSDLDPVLARELAQAHEPDPLQRAHDAFFRREDAELGTNDTEESLRKKLLDEALGLIAGDRNNAYGPPHQDFDRTARMVTAMWGDKLKPGVAIEAHDVATFVILIKLSRLQWTPNKRDNWTDIVGYAGCGYEAFALTHPEVEEI